MKKILVVDDSKTVLGLLKEEFSHYDDVEVFFVKNYEEASALIQRYHEEIEVALLDIHLPDAPNGEIISFANMHNIPTIVLTGTINKEIRATIQKNDIISYIVKDKPSSINLAVKTVRMVLKNSDRTVLIIHDSPSIRAMLSGILNKMNLNVLEVTDAEEALNILKNNKQNISLVITGNGMSGLSGLDLTIKIREMYHKDELGIIAISAASDKDVIDDFLTFGANDFMSKPFTSSEVISRVNSNLELIDLFAQITYMANRDFMTGVYNRRYFFESGNRIFLKAKRKALPVAVAMLDIDKFKNINDMYGHSIGDLAIKEVNKILEKNLRSTDLIARFGGEEFCILLDEITVEDLQKRFEQIRNDFETNILVISGRNIKYTVSFGIAYGMLDSLEEMIKLSDEALYFSKKNGRNQVTLQNA